MRLVAGSLLLLAVTTSQAATLEIQVRERGGSALPDRTVCARLVRSWGWSRGDVRCAATDRTGSATIADLPKGPYFVYIDSLADAELVPTLQNPWGAGPEVVVREETERIPVRLDLDRGVSLWVEVRNEYGDFPEGLSLSLSARDDPGSGPTAISIPATGKRRVVVPPGRVFVQLQHPPSHVLIRLDVDGTPAAERSVALDLGVDRHPRYLTWTLTTGGWLASHVEFVGSPECAGRPVARPSLPDRWTDADPAPLLPVPLLRPGVSCDYESSIPAGRWRVAVEGEGIVASDPPFVEIEIGPGTEARADFRVEVREAETGAVIEARLVAPDGSEVEGGVVEARQSEGGKTLGRASRDPERRFPPFRLARLEEGSTYRIVGSHADWLPAEERATAVDPKTSKPPFVTITLRPGASLRVKAVGPDGEPRPGVRLRMEAAEPQVEEGLEDPLAAYRLGRHGTTDAAGVVAFHGLRSGKYWVDAEATGESADSVVSKIEIDGEGESRPSPREVVLVEGRTVEALVRLVPASRFTGTARCREPWPTPPRATFHIYADEDLDARRGVAPTAVLFLLPRKPQVRRTDSTDRFSVGPLGPGVYRLAVEPEGVWVWSWFSRALRVEDGTPVQVDEPGEVDLGTVDVECGPLLIFRPTGFGLTAVSLAEGALAVDVRPAADEGLGDPVPVRIDPGAGEFLGTHLPEGEVEIVGRATHPFLVPGAVEFGPIRKTLERGGAWTVDLPFRGVGGAVEVRTAAAAVRIAAEDGTTRVAPTKDGAAFFWGVPEGTWKVDACADAACATFEPAGLVSVAPARTTVYPEPSSTP